MSGYFPSNFFTFDCFSHEEVKEINKQIRKEVYTREPIGNASKSATKKGNFFIISCLPLIELINPWLSMCQKINANNFGYDIHWNFHLDALNYNVYEKEDEYV